uniref:Rapamycin-insensitive companion of mTOR n=1 Tax=Photinus pyralis TaxID=7054 RepID=A0A1Y1M3X9_PHOPY
MAVASWMLKKNRNIGSSRYTRSTPVNEEDIVQLDLKRDPRETAKELLLDICKLDGITEGKCVNCINAFIKLYLHIEGNLSKISYTTVEILCCLRITLFNNSSLVRSAGLKAIRHVLMTEDDVQQFNKLKLPCLVARSLDLSLRNDMERIQALSLMQKILLLSPVDFDMGMARSLVALANCGIEEKDRMLRACLACLCELGVLNAELFIASGGVAAITRNLLECQTPRIAESLCGVLLLLLDRPFTRNHAAVDLHCIAAPYCDFHYRHGWMDKNRDERELRFNCSRLALLSVFRSWPGILHFCSPTNSLGLKAIVDILYLNQLEVRKAVLDLLYELLGLPQPEWTDELSVALSAVDPAEPQASWRLTEGFVAAEGRSVLPHLAKTTPNITDIHLSLLLYCFLETGLLCALAEVIATSDTFISVRATVLLGELLRLIQILLPPECCNITPPLPNLLEYATKRPQALGAVTALQQLHKLLKRRPASSSLYLDYILQSSSFMKRTRNLENNKKYKISHTKSRLHQLVLKESDDIVKDTGVLLSKDAFTWNWSIIKIILKGKSDLKLNLAESTHLTFLKRLVEFYLPSNNRYSHMDLTSSKNTQGYTLVGIELIHCLARLEDPDATKLLIDLFTDISNHIKAITTSKSAHDCLFSPQHMSNTQCQTYFLFIGRFATTKIGTSVLLSVKIFEQLRHLATTSKHDCYVKLIVSSLSYEEPGHARDLFASVLKCSVESSRLYATQILQVLLRAGLPQFHNWGIKLLTAQLEDKSRTVRLTTLAALHEACEVPNYLEQLIKIHPDLLHLGEKGVLLLIRFLSSPNGFNKLKKNGFISNEIRRWDEFVNYRYVHIVENEISDTLTLHQRGEDGRYDKRLSSLKVTSRKDLFLPPHIYGQLTRHAEGFAILLECGSVDKYVQWIDNGLCETDDDILKLKVALWSLGHLGSSLKGTELLNSKGILASIIRLVQHCVVYSIRATAFFALSLVATNRAGADYLFKLGWVCTRHDRHNRWPVIEEENWQEEVQDEQLFNLPLGSDSEHTSSDNAFMGEYSVNLPDADSTTTDEDFLMPVDRVGSDVPHRYRDNSITESTTSGVSSCESVLGKIGQNERFHTLSPIPSSSSLSTLKTSAVRMRRHSESTRRISVQSTTPSERSTISPAGSISGKLSHQDMVGYTILRSLRSSRITHMQVEDDFSDVFAPESLLTNKNVDHAPETSLSDYRVKSIRNNYLDSMSLSSLSSVQKFSIKDEQNKGQCYMGICLPRALIGLFPDNQIIARRLSFTGKNDLLDSGLIEGGEEIKIKRNRFRHDKDTCLSCSRIKQRKTKNDNTNNVSNSEVDVELSDLKNEVLKQVERLSNPVWIKQARQALLHYKQQNPQLFHDACLYSEVCKMVSENTYRLGPRRLLQELFLDINYRNLNIEPTKMLSETKTSPDLDSTLVPNSDSSADKALYLNLAAEQRKAELSTRRQTTYGFNINDEFLSPIRVEPRSPPLSSVKEENFSSVENLLSGENSSSRQSAEVQPKIKTLDSLNLSYSQNKFPIRSRSKSDPKSVIK